MTALTAPARHRPLGRSGLTVSGLAWGMWRFAGQSRAEARALVDAAFSAGITLFDTADIYGFGEPSGFGGAEALLGEVFAADPSLRARMVLASKGGIMPPRPYDQSPAYLASAIDASLTRLRTDRIDLYQIHRPDILAHPHEVARTLEDAVRAGKIGHVGVSNFTPSQTDTLQHFLTVPLISTQPELSPLRIDTLQNGELDQALRMDLAVMAWSPLGGGRIGTPQTAREQAVTDALDAVARTQGVSRTAAAYSWIMAHPARPIPIVGSQNPDRIREAANAYTVRWTRTDWYGVLVAARGERLP